MVSSAATMPWYRWDGRAADTRASKSDSLPESVPWRSDMGDAATENSIVVEGLVQSEAAIAPDQVVGARLLQALPEGYRLLRPLVLTIYRAGDSYWVVPDGFVLHGAGWTVAEAIEDYGYVLVEYHEELQQRAGSLSPLLSEHLDYLNQLIARG